MKNFEPNCEIIYMPPTLGNYTANHMPNMCQPYANHMTAKYQHLVNHMQTMCQPHQSGAKTVQILYRLQQRLLGSHKRVRSSGNPEEPLPYMHGKTKHLFLLHINP